MESKKNKTMAGYHILMLLSVVDNKLDVNEDLVIRDFLIEEFPDPIPMDLDKEMEELSSMHPDNYLEHYDKMLQFFLDESTVDERKKMLEFAVSVIQADREVTKEESFYLKRLLKHWGIAK